MFMHGPPCAVACDQTYTKKARISYDAMSVRSCQAQMSANPASGLHSYTKMILRMSTFWRMLSPVVACMCMLCYPQRRIAYCR